MKRSTFVTIVVIALSLAVGLCSAQVFNGQRINGFTVEIPQSSIPHIGRMHTNYFIARPDAPNPAAPPPGAETPGSLACVYKFVKGPKGCPIATSTNVPTGGWGAIAIVDAGDYPTAQSDLDTFSTQFGIPKADFQVVYADGHKPPVYGDWEVEEALDIEWAHAMAPQAKLFLVESRQVNTDPTWLAVKVAGNLVAQNGGGVVSMSWGDPEVANERNWDKFFKSPSVVYFAAAGDSGIGVDIYPGASPNIVSVGGTLFVRNGNGDFETEVYASDGGGADLSPYEPRPSYQNVIQNIVGNHRGYPDIASNFCCAAIYLQGWGSVGGTSWGTPTMAGTVNAAAHKKQSSRDELKLIYGEYANDKNFYNSMFFDIISGSSDCMKGWDLCAGVGSPRTYKGK